MNKENKLLEFLKSNAFILYVALFTVVFQSPNTYYVYHSFSVFASPYREIASAGVAIIVSASIMIYTLRKNFFVAKCYSIFEVGIASYYYIDTIGWQWGLIPAFGIALIIPISVYYYTNEINKEEIDSRITGKEIDAFKKDYEETISRHVMEVQQLLTIIDNNKIDMAGMKQEIIKANEIIDRDAETIAMLTAEVEAQRLANKISNSDVLHTISGESILKNKDDSIPDESFIIDAKELVESGLLTPVKEMPIEKENADQSFNLDLKKKSSKREQTKEQGFWNPKQDSFF